LTGQFQPADDAGFSIFMKTGQFQPADDAGFTAAGNGGAARNSRD
jgi:hypothetical protein